MSFLGWRLPGAFAFLDPGDLRDGDLRLVLSERIAATGSHAPMYCFSMERIADGKHLGAVQFRMGNAPEMILYAGHLGYHVLREFYGHRYAARSVRLLRGLARAHGMPGLWITCDPENKGSRRTCEIVGAECIETVWLPMGHPLRAQGSTRKCRYWWDVADPGACEPA